MTTYRVKDWDERYENNRTRELKSTSWLPLPNKHDGDGYTELLDHKNGPEHFAAWIVILQVASKCDPRGTLLRDSGKPHDSHSLARMTRLPAKIIVEALPRLVQIGWIEADTTIPQDDATIPHDDAGDCRRKKERKKEGKEGVAGKYDGMIPEALKDGRFMEAWHTWIIDRKDRGKPVTQAAAKKQLAMLQKMGVENALLSIDQSIASGWQGLFDPKETGGQTPRDRLPPAQNMQ